MKIEISKKDIKEAKELVTHVFDVYAWDICVGDKERSEVEDEKNKVLKILNEFEKIISSKN